MASVVWLASCGGGGSDANDCSGGKDVRTDLSYPGAFDVYHLAINVPIAPLAAATDGIPAACLSSRRFSVTDGSLPTGLRLDGGTGTITGTPAAEGWFQWVVKVELTGFTGSVAGAITTRVADPAHDTFASWSTLTDQLPISSGRLDAVDTRLVLTSATNDGFLTAQTSADEGATWQVVQAGSRPTYSDGFATAHEGAAVYGTGGQTINTTTLRNDVWKFDGSQWSIRTAAAAFAPRRDAALLATGGLLYVFGGQGAGGVINDAWRSADGGQSWQQTAAAFATAPALPLCAFALNGEVAVVTTRPAGAFVGAASVTEIWHSPDGATWSAAVVPANSALRGLNPAYPQCVVLAGRVYLFGMEDVVSSANLTSWHFEPTFQFDSFPAGGGATIGGHLYVADGLGTSQRTLHRTNP